MAYKKLFEFVRKMFSYKNRNVFDIEHSIDRFHERFPKVEYDIWKRVCEDGIDSILDVFKDSSGKYLIISKSTDIAIQVDWRKDLKSNDNKNHLFTSTTLNYRTQKNVIKGDTKLFVEEIKKYKLEKWFESKNYNKMLKEKSYCISIKLSEECPTYKIYIKEGKIVANFKIIKVK